MALKEIRDIKIDKINRLREMGVNPYPPTSSRTHLVQEALDKFDALSSDGKEIVLAGRIMAQRGHGGAVFFDINDGGHKIQAHIKEDVIGQEGFKMFSEFCDIGDIVEVAGPLVKTKKEERTIDVRRITILSKAILPLPEKWHGLVDVDERFRKRYLDILLNPELGEVFKLKEKFWESTRNFLKAEGFMEVETPTLEVTTGGAEARPFKTHHNDFDLDVFLRISIGELWQKRLMAAGFPKTFEIGRAYRNEGTSPEHAQEFTNMEFYAAYMNFEDGQELIKKLYREVAQKTFGRTKFETRGHTFDLADDWQELDYVGTIKKMTGVDVLKDTEESLGAKLRELGVSYDGENRERMTDSLWKYCRKSISGPAFLVNHPKLVAPLSKEHPDNPELTKTFQVIIAGSEIGRAHSELNDPIDQAKRFNKQKELIEGGDQEAMMPDDEFVEMLEHGMPPTFGFGFGERFFAFLVDKPLRETQLFPLMKPKSPDKKSKELVSAVAVLNRGAGLEPWQELNTIAHLTAALGARGGKALLSRDTIETKDGENIYLNIQHGIVIKQTNSVDVIRGLITEATRRGLKISEFTREMLESTNDRKIAEATKSKSMAEVEFLGVLVFGPKSEVEDLTTSLERYK